jgi:polar amino acid transport system substrate-binding protein
MITLRTLNRLVVILLCASGWALSSAVMAAPQPAGQKSLRLCHEDGDVFPWLMKGSTGLSNILVDTAAEKIGMQIELVVVPWRRCLLYIATGAVAGGFGASYAEERALFAQYPTVGGRPDGKRRIRSETYSMYGLVNSGIKWNGTALTGKAAPLVGAQAGYSIANDLRKRGITVDEGAYNSIANLRKLVAGRVDAAALQTTEGDRLARTPEFLERIERLMPHISEKHYFVIFGKAYYEENKATVEKFWDMLAVVRNSADYKAREAAALATDR